MSIGGVPKFNREEMKKDIKDVSGKYGKDTAKNMFNQIKETEGYKESEAERVVDRDVKDEKYLAKLEQEKINKEKADRLAELDKKYRVYNSFTELPVEEVKNEGEASFISEKAKLVEQADDSLDTKVEKINPSAETVERQEKIEKLEKEIGSLLDKTLSNLPQQMNEYYNSGEYNKLLELNNRKNQEEKELFEAYEKITKGGDGSHHRGFAIGRGTAHYYVDDLKFNNAPQDIIKRFEDFDDKIAKPVFDAEWPLELKSRETITKDKWIFLNTLQQKVDETFKGDQKGREEAYKKWSDSYESNYNKIRKETVPDKEERINTMGTVFS